VADPDGLMSAPPGTPHDAGSANTVSATPAGAVAAALARVAQISQESLTAGDTLGDLMPLTPPPDVDSTVLGALPPGPPQQGGTH
jgi:hypothetical protein